MLVPATNITQDSTWQQALANTVREGSTLLRLLGLNANQVGLSEAAARQFPVRVTHSFIARMQHGNPEDPLLQQVLASTREEALVPGYSSDPVGEVAKANSSSGVLKKYHGRLLLLVTSACAVHCRYCFRRHFPYEQNRNSRADWDKALNEIAQDTSVEEVIFSGGDPLVATDAQLNYLVEGLARIPHIKRLRIHTRLPIVLPERVTSQLVESITASELRTAVVVHANHAQEINADVEDALRQLSKNGITLLNQAVLLKGINATVTDQIALSEALYEASVLPYYLHLLDKVDGAAHFDTTLEDAKAIHLALHSALPGYLVPRLVKEEAGAPGKTLL